MKPQRPSVSTTLALHQSSEHTTLVLHQSHNILYKTSAPPYVDHWADLLKTSFLPSVSTVWPNQLCNFTNNKVIKYCHNETTLFIFISLHQRRLISAPF